MNAEALIDSICEAAKDTVFAYIPGITDAGGVGVAPAAKADPFSWWIKFFFQHVGARIGNQSARDALARPDEFIDLLITKYDGIFIVVMKGDVGVYSFQRVAKNVPREFLSKVTQFVGITPDTPVHWFESVNASPVPTVAAEPIFGMQPPDVAQAQKKAQAVQALPQNLSTSDKQKLRRKFWAPGGFDPSTAPDIVDKLLP